MHPAPSVIVFTTLSGLGFGLLIFLGIGEPSVTGWSAFWFFLIAYILSVGGLAASAFHLGHPERAHLAFTQWRSSWLSREAVCAVAALVAMGLYAFFAVFFGWTVPVLGWIGAALSLATVFTTAMIYTHLKTVPRWNQWLTPIHFISVSLAGGALMAGQITEASVLLLLAAMIQLGHWQMGDGRFAEAGHSIASATGLGTPGRIRAFEPPHTGSNYLLKEMVHVVGRKHSQKLRWISFILAFAVPIALLLFPGAGHLLGGLSVLSHVAGVAASRWLFFAEAEHVVGLYYGARDPSAPTLNG